jgi:hypothetical protein
MFSSPDCLFDVWSFNKSTSLAGCILMGRESIAEFPHHLLREQSLRENYEGFGRAGHSALSNPNSEPIARLYTD